MNKEEKKAIENIKALKILFEIDDKKDFEAIPSVQKDMAKDLKTLLNLIDKMKICIDILDDELKERNKAINKKEIIIEKLQKENERLKTKIDICNCQEKSCREIIESKYIPKEKIKELIKRKKENIEGLHPASDCVLIDDFETQIDVLKQLLEENNYDE